LLKYVKDFLTDGLPKVNLKLNTTEAMSGETISGSCHITGGRKKLKLKKKLELYRSLKVIVNNARNVRLLSVTLLSM
jgi:hypothetical protein